MVRFRFVAALAMAVVAVTAPAQVTPAGGYTPPDDSPSFKVGATIYGDYTYINSPASKDADSNTIHLSSFNISRAYFNVTGNLNHWIGFRITPDISRETGVGSSLAGSQNFRLKYAFGQFNLDDWTTKGSWARFGVQQTPFVDYHEGIYLVHRSDGSGTSYIWCDYLSKVSPDYRKIVGVATSVNWPAGVGAKGNEGVAGLVKQTPGSIGYVELIYALQNKLSRRAALPGPRPRRHPPRQDHEVERPVTLGAALVCGAAGAQQINGAGATFPYPIYSKWFSEYNKLHPNLAIRNVNPGINLPSTDITAPMRSSNDESPKDKQRARTMVDFMKWALTDGQKFAPELGYAPLPHDVIQMELQALNRIRL